MKAFQYCCLVLSILAGGVLVPPCLAHETRPAYLEIKETSLNHYDIVWRIPVNAGMRLPILLQLPADAEKCDSPGYSRTHRFSRRTPCD